MTKSEIEQLFENNYNCYADTKNDDIVIAMTKDKFVEIVSQMQLPVILQGELLPCPFCGSEAELIEKGNDFTKKKFITVKCTNKNCRAEMTNGAIRNSMDWLKGISIEAWNKRAGREPQSK